MRAPLVALVVLLAGCAAPGATEDAPVIERPPLASSLAFEEPIRVADAPAPSATGRGLEAFVSVSPDGMTVLDCSRGYFASTSPGYASLDGGATWQVLEFPPTAGNGGDCETAITESGAWAFLASTVLGATILVSEDEGQTWSVNPVSAVPTNGLADRPFLGAVGNELWLAYMPVLDQPGTIGFVRSTDLGRTWSAPATIGEIDPSAPYARHGHFVVGPDAVSIPILRAPRAEEGSGVLQVWTTRDGGATWEHEVAYTSDEFSPRLLPSLARTGAGDEFLAYTVLRADGTWALYALHRAPGTPEWSEPILLFDAATSPLSWPWISGGHDRAATFAVGTNRLWAGRVDGETGRVETVLLGTIPRGVEFVTIDHDASGRAYVAWLAAGDAQYLARSIDPST